MLQIKRLLDWNAVRKHKNSFRVKFLFSFSANPPLKLAVFSLILLNLLVPLVNTNSVKCCKLCLEWALLS